MKYCTYDNDGNILAIIDTPSPAHAALEGNFLECPEDTLDTTHFVELLGTGPTLRRKTALDTTHQIEGLLVTFSTLPSALKVKVGLGRTVTDSTPTEVEFELPGHYAIELYGLANYVDETVEVALG